MSAINKLKVYNFKAFYQDNEINFNAKHVLLYGENGSGKSSIYWSLYTLLQSENKTKEEIQKYFVPTVDENLINYNYLKARADYETEPDGRVKEPQSIGLNANIEMELNDTNKSKFIIDSTGFSAKKTVGNAEVDDIDGLQKLRNLNRHSDFISHRLLINFYNFRNSKEINLWEVFIRDMFPFLKSDKGTSNSTLWDRYNNLDNILPYNYYANGTFARSGSGYRKKHLLDEVDKLNEDINYWISRMNLILNAFYLKHFEPLYKDKLRITLTYGEPLEYEHYKTQYQFHDNKWYKRGTGFAGFNEPHIGLKLETQNNDRTFTLIHRPQSYLNEARLTSIALAVRFSLLDDTIRPRFPGQFLALDDLLVSLDMSNRDKILDIILTEFAPKYKIYLFTHERAFFNMALEKIKNKGLLTEWGAKEMFASEKEMKPFINEIPNKLKKAEYFLLNNDYPACGIYLRTLCEEVLDRLYPDQNKYKIKMNNDGIYETQNQNLNDKICHLEYYCDIEGINYKDFENLKIYKSAILNSLAHNDISSPIYKIELEKTLEVLKKLQKYKCEQKVFKPNDTFKIDFIKNDGKVYRVGITLCDHLKVLEKDGEFKRASNFCKANITYINDDGVEQKEVKIEKPSIKKLIEDVCNQLDIENTYLVEEHMIYNRDNSTFSSKITTS